MLPILIDENFDHRIVRGLRLRLTQLDFLVVQQIGESGFEDPALLDWAVKEGRVIVTHDVNTVTRHANERLKRGLPMPGVIIVPEQSEMCAQLATLRSSLSATLWRTSKTRFSACRYNFTSALPSAG